VKEAAIQHPLPSNGFANKHVCTAKDECCSLCGPCQDVISRTVSEVASCKVTLALTLSELK
jgi:hypothetical protein